MTATIVFSNENLCSDLSPQGTYDIIFTETQMIKCNGGTGKLKAFVIVTSGTVTGIAYKWSYNNLTSQEITAPSGTYTVTVTSSNSNSKTATFTFIQPSKVNIIPGNIYHGCSNGLGKVYFNCEGGTPKYKVEVVDINGLVFETKQFVIQGESFMNVKERKSFRLRITDSNGCVYTNPNILSIGTTTKSFDNPGITSMNPSCFGKDDGNIKVTPEQILPGKTTLYKICIYKNGNCFDSDIASTATYKNLDDGQYVIEVESREKWECQQVISTNVNIIHPDRVSLTSTVQDASCFGKSDGGVFINVTGGSGGYTYAWSNGNTAKNLSPVAAGTYGVKVVDSKNCVTSPEEIKFTIGQPKQLVDAPIIKNVDCFGASTGSIVSNPSGGNGGYKYLWSNGSASKENKNLKSGTYNLTLTDSKNCRTDPNVQYFSVIQPDDIDNADHKVGEILCYGDKTGSIVQSIKGGVSPYSYIWTDGNKFENRNNIPNGTYICLVADKNSCSKNFSYIVNQPSEIVVTPKLIESETRLKKGSISIEVFGGVAPYEFWWKGPNGFSSRQQNINGLTQGEYILLIYDDNQCAIEKKFIVPFSTGTNQYKLLNYSISINSNNILVITGLSQNKKYHLEIFSSDSKRIISKDFVYSGFAYSQSLSDLHGGTYFMKISDMTSANVSKLIKF